MRAISRAKRECLVWWRSHGAATRQTASLHEPEQAAAPDDFHDRGHELRLEKKVLRLSRREPYVSEKRLRPPA
jgi:hypothetical protein